MLHNTIGYCTAGLEGHDIEAALDVIASIGFGHAQILGQKPHVAVPPQGKALAAFRSGIRKRGLEVSVHAPLGIHTLGGPDEAWRARAADVLADYVRFSGEIEAKAMVVHPVPNPKFVPGDPEDIAERLLDSTRRSLDELVPVAAESAVTLLLENLPYICDYPLRSMKDLRTLVDQYPAETVGLVLDTGHAGVLGTDPVDEIVVAGDRLLGLHLHDTDGEEDRHWAPGQGVLDWDAIVSALRRENYEGVLLFEASHGRYGETPEEVAALCLAMAETWSL